MNVPKIICTQVEGTPKREISEWTCQAFLSWMWNKYGQQYLIWTEASNGVKDHFICLLACFVYLWNALFLIATSCRAAKPLDEAVSAWRKFCSRLFSKSTEVQTCWISFFFHCTTEGNAQHLFLALLKIISATMWHLSFFIKVKFQQVSGCRGWKWQ